MAELSVRLGELEKQKFRNPSGTGIPAVAVVNHDGSNVGNATITLGPGLVTVTMGTALSSSIDSISTVPTGNTTLNPSPNFIGLVTSVIGSAPTLFAVTNSTSGNVTLNPSPNFIGLVTSVIGSAPTLYTISNSNSGNITLNPSPNFIGLVTSVNASPVTVHQGNPPWQIIGNATANLADSGNPVKIGMIYYATATTYDNGDRVDAQGDVNGNLKTTLGTYISGEDSSLDLIKIGGSVLHGAADTGGPVKIGGIATPQTVVVSTASGNRVNAWFDNQGRLGVFLQSGTTVVLSNITLALSTITLALSSSPTINVGSLPTVIIGSLPTVIVGSGGGTATVYQAGAPWQIIGNITSNLTDAGNPVKVGGVYNTSVPTFDNGDRGDFQIDENGSLLTREQYGPAFEDNNNGVAAVANRPIVSSVYSGSAFTEFGATLSRSVKNAPALIKSVYGQNGGPTICYLQIFNLATVPANATTPLFSFPLSGGTTHQPGTNLIGTNFFGENGYYLSVGLSWGISSLASVFSSTGVNASFHQVNGIYL